MSNDNKTLADVQPGGMVRLGDQAERVRFEAWGRTEGLPLARAKLGGYAFEVTAKAWRAWQYLSAQPSPGGQGDVWAIATSAPKLHDQEPIPVEAVAEIFNHPEFGLSINWLLENGIGELQVGDVLMVSDRAITDEDGSGEVYTAPPAQAVDLKPARALLRRRIEQWRSHPPTDPGAPGTHEIETKGEHDYNNGVRIYREGIAVMEEVLALTEISAVGNE